MGSGNSFKILEKSLCGEQKGFYLCRPLAETVREKFFKKRVDLVSVLGFKNKFKKTFGGVKTTFYLCTPLQRKG